MSKIKETQMTAKEIFNIDEKDYLSRSRHGMRTDLIRLGYSFEAADELITSWITDGSIIPTTTPDDHFNLKKQTNENIY